MASATTSSTSPRGRRPRAARPRRLDCHKATQRDESSKLHHSESDQRRVLMDPDAVSTEMSGRVPHLVIGGHAAHVDGKRQDRDDEEHFQPRVLQVFVTTDEARSSRPSATTAPRVGT